MMMQNVAAFFPSYVDDRKGKWRLGFPDDHINSSEVSIIMTAFYIS